MEKSVRKITPLVLALSMVLVCGAFAGDNENATFTVTSSTLLTDVDALDIITIDVQGEGWVDVEQVDVTLVVSSADHFDLTAVAAVLGPELPDASALGNWRSLGGLVEEGSTDRVKVGFALLDPDPNAVGHTGSATFSLLLRASATLTTETTASITIEQVSLGPSATERDVVAVGTVIAVNPPSTAISAPVINPAASEASQITANDE